jgi:fumarate hydratase class I
MAPLTTWQEVNTGSNLPAQIEIYATDGDEYEMLFMAKGGGSANKSYLYQETVALLNPTRLMAWLDEKLRTIGTSACPPYHLAIAIGGTSAEFALRTAKYASARYLDSLPQRGDLTGHAIRDIELEADVLALTQQLGIGAQFGGKYFCHDVRVVRQTRSLLPRGHRRLVLGRPPGPREDHRGRGVPRTTRGEPRQVPSRSR